VNQPNRPDALDLVGDLAHHHVQSRSVRELQGVQLASIWSYQFEYRNVIAILH
jgi:hypothetical protein